LAAVAAFAPPRRAALLGTIAVASRIGYRFGIFGGFRAAALLRARPALLGATLPSTTASAPRLSLRFGNFGGFPAAALCRARLARLAPRSSAPLPHSALGLSQKGATIARSQGRAR
jgi:hypothetical protein